MPAVNGEQPALVASGFRAYAPADRRVMCNIDAPPGPAIERRTVTPAVAGCCARLHKRGGVGYPGTTPCTSWSDLSGRRINVRTDAAAGAANFILTNFRRQAPRRGG